MRYALTLPLLVLVCAAPAQEKDKPLRPYALWQAYHLDEESADKTYKGKQVTLSGSVWVANHDKGGAQFGLVTVEGPSVVYTDVIVRFPASQRDKVKDVKQLSKIVLRGTVAGSKEAKRGTWKGFRVYVDDCELIEHTPFKG